MFHQTFLIASAAAVAFVVAPDAADARDRAHYHYYGQPYYGQGYGYPPQYYGYRYGQPAYGYGYGYERPYYGQRRYYRGRRDRCGSGTTGLIVGGAAGALLGREIERGGDRYRYYDRRYYRNRGGGTTGAIVGGAVGALIGRSIARSC